MDRLFSVPLDDDGSRAMLDAYGGGEIEIEVGRKRIRFQFSDRFGPMPVTDTGAERSLGPRHPFWRAVSLWCVQGRRVQDGTAIWHEPKKPVLERLGGRHYRVIEDGEIGHDW